MELSTVTDGDIWSAWRTIKALQALHQCSVAVAAGIIVDLASDCAKTMPK